MVQFWPSTAGKYRFLFWQWNRKRKSIPFFEEFIQFQSFKFLVLKKSTFYFFKVAFLSGYHMKKTQKEIKTSEVHEIPMAHC